MSITTLALDFLVEDAVHTSAETFLVKKSHSVGAEVLLDPLFMNWGMLLVFGMSTHERTVIPT